MKMNRINLTNKTYDEIVKTIEYCFAERTKGYSQDKGENFPAIKKNDLPRDPEEGAGMKNMSGISEPVAAPMHNTEAMEYLEKIYTKVLRDSD